VKVGIAERNISEESEAQTAFRKYVG